MTTDIQDRVISHLIADPRYGRADVRPLADGSVEVFAYDTDGVLDTIHTVFASGSYGTRPGFRVTTDRSIRI